MSEQNSIPTAQPPVQTPAPLLEPTPTAPPHKPAHTKKDAGHVFQIVFAVVAILALLLSIVANLRISIAMTTSNDNIAKTFNAQSSKKNHGLMGFKTVEFKPKGGSQLEWDYNDTHVKLGKLEVKGNKATLSAKVTNNGDDSDVIGCSFNAFQNGMQTGNGYIIAQGRVQPGYSVTVTAKFEIKDSSQPITLEFDNYSQNIQVEFNPASN